MRRTQMQVSDWMTRNPVTVTPRTSLARAYELMLEHEIRRLPVVDNDRDLVGIITLSDILRALPSLLEEEDNTTRRLLMISRQVGTVMTYDPITADPEDSIQEAAERMLEHKVSGLPVISGGRLVGIITESDIFRLVVESWTEAAA